MQKDNVSFIAFAAHNDVRSLYAAGHPLLAINAEDGRIVWANAAGARFFGHSAITGMLNGRPATNLIAFRQFKAAAAQLERGASERKLFTIYVTQRFRRLGVTAEAIPLTVDGDNYILFSCNPGSADRHILVEGFSADEAHLALVDKTGTLLEASKGFSDASVAPEIIAQMCDQLSDHDLNVTDRLTTTDSGIWPLTLGRLSDNPATYLLFVSGEITDVIAGEERIAPPPEPDAAVAAPERSARDVIDAIDGQLEALAASDDAPEEQPDAPLIRRFTPEERPAPPNNGRAGKRTQTIRRPVRFVWRTDKDGRFTEVSHELAEAVGSQVADIIGMRFEELETRLGVRGGKAIEQLIGTSGTWSGKTVFWPIAGSEMVVPVDLAALPTYTRERLFEGFRGFGLVRLGEETLSEPEDNDTALPFADLEEHETDNRSQLTNQLNEDERRALGEIADRLKAMGAGLEDETEDETDYSQAEKPHSPILRKTAKPRETEKYTIAAAEKIDATDAPMLVQSGDDVLHVNPAFLALSGYGSRTAIVEAGGPDALIARDQDEQLFLVTSDDGRLPVSIHLQTIKWQRGHALAMTVRPDRRDEKSFQPASMEAENQRQASGNANEADGPDELRAILETAADGIIIIRQDHSIRSLSASALALFGLEPAKIAGMKLSSLFAEESWRNIEERIERLEHNARATIMPDGLEAIACEASGGLIPVFMTLGRMPKSGEICAVLRDITGWKQHEDALRCAKRDARQAEQERDVFLATLRHELRQPLDAIVSLSDTISNERFGPLGDDHYHALAREIASKGRQAREAVNRLLGEKESKAAPNLMPSLSGARLNETIAEAVSLIQPGANARRIIVRTALSPSLNDATGDTETLKAIVTQLVEEAVRSAPAGGQVIVSTAQSQAGETVMRLRDHGTGERSRVNPAEGGPVHAQDETPRLAKARKLTEGLSGRLEVHALANEGTLVEVFFKVPDTLAKRGNEQ